MRRADPPLEQGEADAPRAPSRLTRIDESDPSSIRDGVFGGLLTPHPASTTGERILQLALTAVGAPVIVTTLVIVGWLDVRSAIADMRRGESPRPPISIGHPFAWVIGALGAGLGAFAAERPPLEIAAWALVPLVALFARRSLIARIEAKELVMAAWRKRRAPK